MDDAKKILGCYASGAAGTAAGIASTVVLGLASPISIAIGFGVAVGGLIAVINTD